MSNGSFQSNASGDPNRVMIRDEEEVKNRKGEKVPTHIFQIEQHTPVTQFWKKIMWEVGIDKGHFMNGKAIRAGLAKQYENKRPQDVRMFMFSVTGRDPQQAVEKWKWLETTDHVMLHDMNENNFLTVIRDSDKVQLTPKLNLALGGKVAKALIILVASCEIFDQFSDAQGEIKTEFLSPIPSRPMPQAKPLTIAEAVPSVIPEEKAPDSARASLLEMAQRLNKDLGSLREAFGDDLT